MSAHTLARHWIVDPNTGVSYCGAPAGCIPAREAHGVTCRRCQRMREWSYEAAQTRQRAEWRAEVEAMRTPTPVLDLTLRLVRGAR